MTTIKNNQNNFTNIKTFCKENDIEWVLDEFDKVSNYLLELSLDELCVETDRKVWWKCKDCGKSYLLSPKDKIFKYILKGKTPCPFAEVKSLKWLILFRCQTTPFCFLIKKRPVH